MDQHTSPYIAKYGRVQGQRNIENHGRDGWMKLKPTSRKEAGI